MLTPKIRRIVSCSNNDDNLLKNNVLGDKEAAPIGTQKQTTVSQQQQLKQQELLRAAVQEATVPKEAPSEFEFIADPPSISAFDLDVVISLFYLALLQDLISIYSSKRGLGFCY